MTDKTKIPWNEITDELLQKYGGAAPRYTSYPTAPEWSSEFGPDDYKAVLAKVGQDSASPISIYVHVPFCKERCLYCGCASWLPTSDDVYDVYLDALEQETQAVAKSIGSRKLIRGIHWGGGTPTTLTPKRIERLFKIVSSRFDISKSAEVAVEVAPAVTSHEQVEVLAGLGFNRMSLGVQDFNPDVQQAVNRIQSLEDTQALFNKAKACGFGGINIDLMYGLPKQKLDTWKQTLGEVIQIGPDRLAVFGYAHVPWMRPHQTQINENELPSTELRFELFKTAHDTLVDSGYVYIGMDHFARRDDELALALKEGRLWRNFQGYTTDGSAGLLGLGVTAIGDLEGTFAQNKSDLESYQKIASSAGLATFRGMTTSKDDRLRRRVITDLMCNLRLDISKIENEFGIDFWATFNIEKPMLKQLMGDGILEFDDKQISVTSRGRIFVRHVGVVFDTYTRKRAQTEGGPRFSKTV